MERTWHPLRDELVVFEKGHATPAERERIEKHLCVRCQLRRRSIRNILAVVPDGATAYIPDFS